MPATSFRNLVAGSGTVNMTSGSKVLAFTQAQSFKEGTTISCANGQLFTIDVGSGTSWTVMQAATATASGQSFNTTDASTSRARGSGVIVPNAVHNLYYADRDAAGAPDWFFYVDTIFPENGVHPYTKDWYAGPPWVSSKTVQALIPDVATRVRVVEGALRGASGSLFSPDSRLSSLESKLVPVGCLMAYAGATAPGGWLLCDGSAVSRTTYAALFGIIGTAFGAGDGSTTFNLPDLRGRVAAGKDNMGGTSANRLTGGGTLGASGGNQTHTLATGELPAHSHGVTDPGHAHGVSDSGHTHGVSDPGHSHTERVNGQTAYQGGGVATIGIVVRPAVDAEFNALGSNTEETTTTATTGITTTSATTGVTTTSATTGISVANAGSGGAHNNLQPYQVLNYIIKATVNLDGGQGPYTYAQLLGQGDQAPA